MKISHGEAMDREGVDHPETIPDRHFFVQVPHLSAGDGRSAMSYLAIFLPSCLIAPVDLNLIDFIDSHANDIAHWRNSSFQRCRHGNQGTIWVRVAHPSCTSIRRSHSSFREAGFAHALCLVRLKHHLKWTEMEANCRLAFQRFKTIFLSIRNPRPPASPWQCTWWYCMVLHGCIPPATQTIFNRKNWNLYNCYSHQGLRAGLAIQPRFPAED